MAFSALGKHVSDSINAKTCGLKGDGVTDDSMAFINMLNSSGERFYIPSGTYILTKTIHIPEGKEIFGDGETTILKLGANFTLTEYPWRNQRLHETMNPIIYAHSNTKCSDIKLVGDTTEPIDQLQVGFLIKGSNVYFRNVSTDNINYFPEAWRDWQEQHAGMSGYSGYAPGNHANPGIGIFVFEASNVRIYGGKHTNCGYQAIGTDHATDIVVDGVYCGNTNAVGLQIHMASKRIVFTNCIVNNFGENTSNFTLHGYPWDDTTPCEDLIISNCILGGNAHTVGFQSVWGLEKNVMITGCKITSEKEGIIIHRSPVQDIPIGSSARDYVIANNIINAGADSNGITFNGDYCTITGNVIYYGGSSGIVVTGEHKMVDNNLEVQNLQTN